MKIKKLLCLCLCSVALLSSCNMPIQDDSNETWHKWPTESQHTAVVDIESTDKTKVLNDNNDLNYGKTYKIKGQELGQYGSKIILNDDKNEKIIYKLPKGKYEASAESKETDGFFIIKDGILTNKENKDSLQYVSKVSCKYRSKEIITLKEDESILIPKNDTSEFIFKLIIEPTKPTTIPTTTPTTATDSAETAQTEETTKQTEKTTTK